MWRSVTLDLRIGYPPERIFPYLADPARWPEFAPAVESRRRIGDGPPTVGSRWAAVDRIGPFRVRFTDELTELVLDQRVVWLSTSPWNSRVEYRLVPDADRTRVLACYEGDVAGWLRLVALLPTVVLAQILVRDFRGLRRCLEAEDQTAARVDVSAPGQAAVAQVRGGMFWFRRNRFVGSYSALIARRRSQVAPGYAARTRSGPSSTRKFT
jgi:hypothetical protein